MKYNYETIQEFRVLEQFILDHREIEFEYGKTMYSINHSDKWYLTEFYTRNQEFDTPQELLEKGMICGKKLRDIWDDVDVKAMY